VFASSTTTQIHDASHQPAPTTIEAGTPVHDFVPVTGQPGEPVPTGSVTVLSYTNGTCTSPPSGSGGAGLDASGHADVTRFTVTPAAGRFSFAAESFGDSTYQSSDSACEPLTVVDANIQITPTSAQNPIGTTHTVTGHVNVNDGGENGYTSAPD